MPARRMLTTIVTTIITTIAMLITIIMPIAAYADTTQYQLLDGRKREDQLTDRQASQAVFTPSKLITVSKVWDDGLLPEDR